MWPAWLAEPSVHTPPSRAWSSIICWLASSACLGSNPMRWNNPAARIAGLRRHLPEAHSGGLEDRAREQDPQSQLEAGDGEAASRRRWMMDLPP